MDNPPRQMRRWQVEGMGLANLVPPGLEHRLISHSGTRKVSIFSQLLGRRAKIQSRLFVSPEDLLLFEGIELTTIVAFCLEVLGAEVDDFRMLDLHVVIPSFQISQLCCVVYILPYFYVNFKFFTNFIHS